MCGINGINWADRSVIARMNALTEERGPDHSGFYLDSRVSLGHNLLATRADPAVSKQPAFRKGSPWVLVFTGQLYNTGELKSTWGSELATLSSDTAILYEVICRHGWQFTKYVHGMYAIALYHRDERKIVLYRDPTGQKQLYYYWNAAEFVFSSEIDAILAVKTIPRRVNERALTVALTLGYVPGSETILEGIHKVKPGERIAFSLDEKQLSKSTFPVESGSLVHAEPSKVFHHLISAHMESNSKVALNLSGGLDSGLLLHEATSIGVPLHTYSTFFWGASPRYNEDASLAKRLAADYSVKHNEISITVAEYLDHLVEAYSLLEEPSYNPSVPTYYLTAKRQGQFGDGFRVVLSGDGGDEVFGGYDHYRQRSFHQTLTERLVQSKGLERPRLRARLPDSGELIQDLLIESPPRPTRHRSLSS